MFCKIYDWPQTNLERGIYSNINDCTITFNCILAAKSWMDRDEIFIGITYAQAVDWSVNHEATVVRRCEDSEWISSVDWLG